MHPPDVTGSTYMLTLSDYPGGGTGGWVPGNNGGRKSMGGGRRGGGRRDSKGGGSQEKWEKFCNIGTIFHSKKITQRREPLRKTTGTGSAGYGRREVQPLLSPPPIQEYPRYGTNLPVSCTGHHISQIKVTLDLFSTVG